MNADTFVAWFLGVLPEHRSDDRVALLAELHKARALSRGEGTGMVFGCIPPVGNLTRLAAPVEREIAMHEEALRADFVAACQRGEGVTYVRTLWNSPEARGAIAPLVAARDRDVRLAAVATASPAQLAARLLVETDTEVLRDLARRLAEHGEYEPLVAWSRRNDTRVLAVWALGELPTRRPWPDRAQLEQPTAVRDVLLEHLDDRSPEVATWAARSLGKLRIRQAAPRLRTLLRGPARAGAVEALALLRDPEVVPAFAAALGDPQTRASAIRAIEGFGADAQMGELAFEGAVLDQLLALEPQVAEARAAFAAIRNLVSLRAADASGLTRPIYVPRTRGRACLAELDRVAFHTMPHAYNLEPPHTPELLRQLVRSPTAAFDEICSRLCHQGTLYVQTAHAVPFLIALAATPRGAWRGVALAAALLIRKSAQGTQPGVAKVREAFDACDELIEWFGGRDDDVGLAAAYLSDDEPDFDDTLLNDLVGELDLDD